MTPPVAKLNMLERGMTATAALLAMAAVGLLSLMAGEAECLELPSRRNNVGGGGKVRKGTHEHLTLPLHSQER